MPHIVDIVIRPKLTRSYTQETTQTEHRSRRRSRAWHWHLCETRWVCVPSALSFNIWRSNKPLSSMSMLTNNREKLESSESRWVLFGWEDASQRGEDHTAATSCFTCWTLFTHNPQEGGREDEKCSNFKWEEKPRGDHHFFHLFLLSSEKIFVFDVKHINLQTSRADETQMLVICNKVMLKLIWTSVEHFGGSAKWYLHVASRQTSAMISI